jgi:hypothetical protein
MMLAFILCSGILPGAVASAASATGHPVPPPVPRPYTTLGSIDVGTLENTVFWWANHTYVLENIGCGCVSIPVPARHPLARCRRMQASSSLPDFPWNMACTRTCVDVWMCGITGCVCVCVCV